MSENTAARDWGMGNKPKFTWGDVVVVTFLGEQASICGICELDDGFAYTVEFGDGTDKLINERDLESIHSRGD